MVAKTSTDQTILQHHPPASARGLVTRIFWLSVLSLGVFFAVRPAHAAATDIETIISDTNQQRVEHHLPKLTHRAELDRAAELRAKDMFQQQYFSHYAPDGTPPWPAFRQAGYMFTQAAENLAMDFSEVTGVVAAWINSSGHRQNILGDNFSDIGVAVLNGQYEGHDTTIVVQLFGRPSGAMTVLAKSAPTTPTAAGPTPAPVKKKSVTKKPVATQPPSVAKKSVPQVTAPKVAPPPVPEPLPPALEIPEKIPSLVFSEGMIPPTLHFTLIEPPLMPPVMEHVAPIQRTWVAQTIITQPTNTMTNTIQFLILSTLLIDVGLLSLAGVLRPGSWHTSFSLFPVTTTAQG